MAIPVTSVPEHQSQNPSPVGNQLQASPVEMVTSGSTSHSVSPHNSNGPSPSHTGIYPYTHSQSISSSTSGQYTDSGLDDDSLWDFSGDGFPGFRLVVPTHSVSAPASAHPGSMGARQNHPLMAPVNIPGKTHSLSPGGGSNGVAMGGYHSPGEDVVEGAR